MIQIGLYIYSKARTILKDKLMINDEDNNYNNKESKQPKASTKVND